MGKRRAGRHIVISILALILLLAFSQAACAEYKESMHKAWHRHKDNFTVEGKFFIVKASGTPNKVVITANSDVVVVENGTCVDKANMSLCLNDFKSPEIELHRLYTPEEYEYQVEIWFYLANISLIKEMEKRDMLIGEKIRVEVIIQNDGSLPASNIDFRDIYFWDYYPDFHISNVYGCSFSRHNVSWRGVLKPHQTKICSYDIQAIKATTFGSQAEATYLAGVGNRTRTAVSEKIIITVPEYELDIKRNLSSTSAWAGDELDFNVVLNNTMADKGFDSVALTIHIPEGLELVDYSDALSPNANMIRWSGRIDSLEAMDFWARFKVIFGGDSTIKTNLNYKMNNLVRFLDEFDNITGKIDSLELQYVSFADAVKAGSQKRFFVNINNPSSRYVFKNVKVNISTDLPVSFDKLSFEEIGKKQFRSLIERNITMPAVKDITYYNISFDVEYETEYGQLVRVSETRTITAIPKGEGIPGAETRKEVRQKIQEMGISRIIIIFIIVGFFFLISVVYFVRKIRKKTSEQEQDEDEGE